MISKRKQRTFQILNLIVQLSIFCKDSMIILRGVY